MGSFIGTERLIRTSEHRKQVIVTIFEPNLFATTSRARGTDLSTVSNTRGRHIDNVALRVSLPYAISKPTTTRMLASESKI